MLLRPTHPHCVKLPSERLQRSENLNAVLGCFRLKHRSRQALSPIMQRAEKVLMRQNGCERRKRIKAIFEMIQLLVLNGIESRSVGPPQRAIRCLMTSAHSARLFIPIVARSDFVQRRISVSFISGANITPRCRPCSIVIEWLPL